MHHMLTKLNLNKEMLKLRKKMLVEKTVKGEMVTKAKD